jgi:hypothetical protein
MFMGHYAPAFVAATSRKSPRLGVLFVAAQLVDIAFFSLLLFGVEHMRLVPYITAMNPMDLYDMPWDHSLLAALGWAALFAVVIRLALGNRMAGWIGGGVVLSHWLLDLLVHRPDLTLAGGPPALGLGLWNYPWIEMPLEIVLAFGGLGWFVARTRPVGQAGRWSPIVLGAALMILQVIDWTTPQPVMAIDPAPASIGALGLVAYAIATALAWWVARSRKLA